MGSTGPSEQACGAGIRRRGLPGPTTGRRANFARKVAPRIDDWYESVLGELEALGYTVTLSAA